ncbi:hypothetical protein BD311DRAFT_792278 [Dichomitus squalens]|uniref:Uncharacterized protein n=1 Tax=Dichomitus squalens TaxID=114155 RepID=A0A4Q9M9C6_9APHY|nr:hypothetical protein BD311DRAFT_792278 [Dichomitus squalens]
MDPSQLVFVDDGDLNDLLFQLPDAWQHEQGEHYYSSTYSNGFTNAQAEFRFNGTNVSVYGAQLPRPSDNASAVPPSVSFAIDGVIPMVVVSDPDANTTEFAYQFFDSHTLPAGEHVLTITVEYGEDDWPFTLDYVEYTPLPALTGSTSSESMTARDGEPSHTVPMVGGVVGAAVVLGGLAFASWWYWRRKRAPARLAKKYGHYVYEDAKKKPDLATHFGEYKPPPEPTMMDTVASYPVQETHLYAYHPTPINETVLYPLTRRGSLDTFESLSEIDFAHSQMRSQFSAFSRTHTPQSSVYLLRPQPSSSSISVSRPGTPSGAYGGGLHRPIPTPPPALRRPSSPPISYRSATSHASLVSYSTTNSRAPLMLAPGSTYTSSGATPSAKRAEAEKASGSRPKKPATFHADSGVRFKKGDALPAVVAPSTSAKPPPSAFLRTDTGKRDDVEERRKNKAKYVSLAGTAISEVPPMYTEE